MDVNYARLCLPYLAATMLHKGSVTLDDFEPAALADPQRHALAASVVWGPNAVTDPNALAPQTLTVKLSGSREHRIELPAVLGHPDRPLPAAAQRAKFDACCRFAGLAPDRIEALHAGCQALPLLEDLRDFALLKPESA
jgi:aconitate decarboxylase